MISRILAFSIEYRWFVVLLSIGAVALGLWSLARLPIDAVPDITNKQVQINTTAFALSPVEIEKQVTFRIETALAGIPGLESTRSISRNGFSQVTAVFTEKTDIYFARQQVSERLLELRPNLPPGAAPKMGPISTGLSEIYMWSVGFAPTTPDDRIELILERNGAHVAVNPAHLHVLRVRGRPGSLQEHLAEILARDLIAPLSQGDRMPPVAAAQIKDSAARR